MRYDLFNRQDAGSSTLVHIPAVDTAAKPLHVGVNMHSSDDGKVILWVVNALVGHCI